MRNVTPAVTISAAWMSSSGVRPHESTNEPARSMPVTWNAAINAIAAASTRPDREGSPVVCKTLNNPEV